MSREEFLFCFISVVVVSFYLDVVYVLACIFANGNNSQEEQK